MQIFKLLGVLTDRRITEEEFRTEGVPDYLKVLNEFTYYPFYHNLSYNNELKEFKVVSSEITDLFSLEKDINKAKYDLSIQVSAIVGKNGVGKSTLFDLIYLAIYNLGCHFNRLEYFDQHGASIVDENGEELKIGQNVKYQKRRLFFTILFQIDNSIYSLKFNDLDVSLHKGELPELGRSINFSSDDLILSEGENVYRKFFYSIAINYSIYGLNSRRIGNWINSLFHKNDGYRIPVVINPMRTEGNFDINDELSFSNDRIIANVISEQIEKERNHQIMLTDKQYVKAIKFSLKDIYKGDSKLNVGKNLLRASPELRDFILIVQEVFFGIYGTAALFEAGLQLPFVEEVYSYLKHKYDKITSTYEEYSLIRDNTKLSEVEKLRKVLEKISKDNSHVTFKFKQCINFLNINLNPEKVTFWTDTRENKFDSFEKTFEVVDLIEWSGLDHSKNISEYLPPSIFKKEVILAAHGDSKGTECTIGDLSSGEQQLINSVQTVTYHLNNIQSVHYSGDQDRMFYDSVNIMFDEIELYFHPDYQRRFLKELIRAITRLELGGEKGIKRINILFATHSPFILSDIPSSNVLRLTLDSNKHSIVKLNDSQTFGANIHDLLKSKFFLEKGFIGEFAKEWIEDLIKFLKFNNTILENNSNQKNKFRWDSIRAKHVISSIGEPLLKMKLAEMYDTKFNDDFEIELLRARIKDIEDNKR